MAFRLTPFVPPEAELHYAVVRALNLLVQAPAFWACYPAGHIALSPAQTTRLVRAGLKRGMPDLLFWHGGHSYGIELKRPGASLSSGRMARTARGAPVYREGQRDVFPRLKTAGMTIAVCTSLDEVVDQLRAWHFPLRHAQL